MRISKRDTLFHMVQVHEKIKFLSNWKWFSMKFRQMLSNEKYLFYVYSVLYMNYGSFLVSRYINIT